jgi:hypothetical protein
MLDDGAGQARRLEAVLRDASTTRATCMVAAAAFFASWPVTPTCVSRDASFEQSAAPPGDATMGDRGIYGCLHFTPEISSSSFRDGPNGPALCAAR